MNAETAAALLPCYRPGKVADNRTLKAVKFAEKDPELQRLLTAQMRFDEELIEVIHYIQPPENLRAKLGELRARPQAVKPTLRRQVVNPAGLTIVLGLALIAGVVIFFLMEAMAKFPGREVVERMLSNASKMTGNELEMVATSAGQLGDWFYMRGYEGYEAPPELAGLPVAGSRVYRSEGRPIAQVAIGTPEELRCLVYEFRATDFGVQLPPDGDWILLEEDAWAGAIRQRGERCFLLAFRGTKSGMRDFLKGLPKK